MGQGIRVLSEAIWLLREEISKGIPAQQIQLLLQVAERPGISMPEIGRLLEMPQGTVSRNVKSLSLYYEWVAGERRACGHGLLRTDADPENPPALLVLLTGKGETLVRKLASIVEARD